MAERRMFAKSIVLSDAFLDMPMSARCLYFTLGMLADDDGFVGNPKSIMRQCGATNDDMKILLAKRYVLGFESGIIVIKHWRMNNYLQNDRHKTTTYVEELNTLTIDEKGAYTEKNDTRIQSVYNLDTQDRIGKDSKGKDRIGKDILFAPHDDTSNAIYLIALKEKDKYQSVYKEDIDLLQGLYPELNVEQEIRGMVAWSLGNPTKRKTQSGIKGFITRWLNREQNKLSDDPTKEEARKAYIKDVEMKQNRNEKKGDLYYDTVGT